MIVSQIPTTKTPVLADYATPSTRVRVWRKVKITLQGVLWGVLLRFHVWHTLDILKTSRKLANARRTLMCWGSGLAMVLHFERLASRFLCLMDSVVLGFLASVAVRLSSQICTTKKSPSTTKKSPSGVLVHGLRIHCLVSIHMRSTSHSNNKP